MVKALVPAPNTGGQHWEQFYVLGELTVLLYRVFAITIKQNVRFQERMHPEKIRLDQI